MTKDANRIAMHLQEFLARKLTPREQILCEEMACNVYVSAVLQYIDRLTKRGAPRTFAAVYFPIINGVTKNALRRGSIYKIPPQVERTYWRLHGLMHPVFSNADFEHIVWLADAKEDELTGAVASMRSQGVRSVAYLRAIVENMRERARKTTKPAQPMTEALPVDKPQQAVDLEESRAEWKRKAEDTEVEIHARHDTADKTEGTAK